MLLNVNSLIEKHDSVRGKDKSDTYELDDLYGITLLVYTMTLRSVLYKIYFVARCLLLTYIGNNRAIILNLKFYDIVKNEM